MIVANRKSLDEILQMIKPYKKVLLLGCNECVTVCAVGGEREVGALASELRLSRAKDGEEIEVREQTLERQCDPEYIDQVRPFVGDYEAILSMACGAGVQYVAERFRTKPVFPAVNTTFLGVALEQGVWAERCQGCGTCILDKTAGICPIEKRDGFVSLLPMRLRRKMRWRYMTSWATRFICSLRIEDILKGPFPGKGNLEGNVRSCTSGLRNPVARRRSKYMSSDFEKMAEELQMSIIEDARKVYKPCQKTPGFQAWG